MSASLKVIEAATSRAVTNVPQTIFRYTLYFDIIVACEQDPTSLSLLHPLILSHPPLSSTLPSSTFLHSLLHSPQPSFSPPSFTFLHSLHSLLHHSPLYFLPYSTPFSTLFLTTISSVLRYPLLTEFWLAALGKKQIVTVEVFCTALSTHLCDGTYVLSIYTCICVRVCVRICVCTCICIGTCICVRVCVCICVCTCIGTCICVGTCVCIYVWTHMYSHVCTRRRMQIQLYDRSLCLSFFLFYIVLCV